jgi:hypothetical protein
MFELAHSWGYPHPDLMLAQMTARQASEMIAYLNYESDRRKRAEALASEERIKDQLRGMKK